MPEPPPKSTSLLLGAPSIKPFSCPSEQYKPAPTLKTWANNLTFSTETYHPPASTAKLSVYKNKKIKVSGTKHSFCSIIDCRDQIMTCDDMR